ncbi:MAG: restriction endonuclease subunit S, partial [Candidatus Binatia bacterium]
ISDISPLVNNSGIGEGDGRASRRDCRGYKRKVMSLTLRPYPEYRDSGLPWLGEIPTHWDLVKTKYLFRERIEKGFSEEPLLAATQTRGVVRKEHYENRTVLAMKDLHLLKLVRVGDFVISLRSFQGGIEYAHYQGIISPAYTVLCPSQRADPQFFSSLLKSRPYIENLTIFVTGIRQGQNIDYERLSRSFLPVPPDEEQSAIASYLAHFDRRINHLIRAKRRLIELLNEQKQAIIHRAVTRGLDPKVRLKPSGIEWLGDVPDHYSVVPLRWHMSVGSGEFISADQLGLERSPERPFPVIGGNGVMAYSSRFNTQEITIVIGRVGALCGNIHLVTEQSWITDNALRVTNIKGFDMKYLALQLQAMNLNRLANANAQPLVTGGMIKMQRVIKPKTQEQRRIVQQLHDAVAPVDSAIDRALRKIELLREYRTRLIADVVTGKLDVRGVELPALDESEDLDDLDTVESTEIGEGEDKDLERLVESDV